MKWIEMDWAGAYPESFHMLGSNWEISRPEQVLLQIEFNDSISGLKLTATTDDVDKILLKHIFQLNDWWFSAGVELSLDSIAVSLFVDCLSFSNTESEANPNNNLMLR